ncbi:RhoGEF domain containing protein [Balamuthia mandrillaris]
MSKDKKEKEEWEKHERLRNEVIKELVETESAYVDHLSTIVEVFVEPIKEKNILTPPQVQVIFSNIALILTINTELLEKLRKVKKNKPSTQNIGEIFLSMADYLKMYTQYCSNQGRALAEIERLELENERFKEFLEQCKSKPRCQRQDIGSFIIKPIQRICKYPLLLKEIKQHTPKDHFDYENLEAAYNKVTEVVTDVNENKRRMESVQKLLEIQNTVLSDGVPVLKLVAPGRRFVHEGTLTHIEAGKEKERQYFLLNDMIILAKNTRTKSASRTIYKLSEEISLTNSRIHDLPDGDSMRNAFELLSTEKAHTFTLSTTPAKAELLQLLHDLVKVYSANGAEGSGDDDRRGGHSISLVSPSLNVLSYAPGRFGQDMMSMAAQTKESEIKILQKQNKELDQEHKKVRADFVAVMKANDLLLKKRQRIEEQIEALEEEKWKLIQSDYDKSCQEVNNQRRARDYRNEEERRKAMEQTRKSMEGEDDSAELEGSHKREQGGGVKNRLVDLSTELWKNPFPEQVYKSFDILASLAKDMNVELSPPEVVLVGFKGHGKSTLLEALLGHPFLPFQQQQQEGTKLPLCLSMRHNPDCKEPRFSLVYYPGASSQGAGNSCEAVRPSLEKETIKGITLEQLPEAIRAKAEQYAESKEAANQGKPSSTPVSQLTRLGGDSTIYKSAAGDMTVPTWKPTAPSKSKKDAFNHATIEVVYEWEKCWDLRLIDTPGLMYGKSGTRKEREEVEKLVRRFISPPNRLILCVEEFAPPSDQSTRARNYLYDLIGRADPAFARTLFVHTKFHLLLTQVTAEPSLLGQLLAQRPFNSVYVSLLNSAARAKVLASSASSISEQYRTRLIQCYARDVADLEKMDCIERLAPRLGVNHLRRRILELGWRKHQELIPMIPFLMASLQEETERKTAVLKAQLEEVEKELNALKQRPQKLRSIASGYATEFLEQVFCAMESRIHQSVTAAMSSAIGSGAVGHQRNKEVSLKCKSKHVDISGKAFEEDSVFGLRDSAQPEHLKWTTPYWDSNIDNGGAQLRKLITEFRDLMEQRLSLQFTAMELATVAISALQPPQSSTSPSSPTTLEEKARLQAKAVEMAENKFRELARPLIQALFARAKKIMKRIAAAVDLKLRTRTMLDYTSAQWLSSPATSSSASSFGAGKDIYSVFSPAVAMLQRHNPKKTSENNSKRFWEHSTNSSGYFLNGLSLHQNAVSSSSCSSEDNNIKLQEEMKRSGLDGDLHERVRRQMQAQLLHTFQQSSPQLAYMIKDQFLGCVKRAVKRAEMSCLEEIDAPRLIYVLPSASVDDANSSDSEATEEWSDSESISESTTTASKTSSIGGGGSIGGVSGIGKTTSNKLSSSSSSPSGSTILRKRDSVKPGESLTPLSHMTHSRRSSNVTPSALSIGRNSISPGTASQSLLAAIAASNVAASSNLSGSGNGGSAPGSNAASGASSAAGTPVANKRRSIEFKNATISAGSTIVMPTGVQPPAYTTMHHRRDSNSDRAKLEIGMRRTPSGGNLGISSPSPSGSGGPSAPSPLSSSTSGAPAVALSSSTSNAGGGSVSAFIGGSPLAQHSETSAARRNSASREKEPGSSLSEHSIRRAESPLHSSIDAGNTSNKLSEANLSGLDGGNAQLMRSDSMGSLLGVDFAHGGGAYVHANTTYYGVLDSVQPNDFGMGPATRHALQREFIPMATLFFEDIRSRITCNVLLKFHQYVIVPLVYERGLLSSGLQLKLNAMNSNDLEELFDVSLYLKRLKQELSSLEDLANRCKQREDHFYQIYPNFSHPSVPVDMKKERKMKRTTSMKKTTSSSRKGSGGKESSFSSSSSSSHHSSASKKSSSTSASKSSGTTKQATVTTGK